METFPIYLFIFIVFLNRYVFGLYLTLVRRQARSTRRSRATSRPSRSSCRSSTRAARSTTRSSSLVAARLPGRQAVGHRRRRLLDRRQLRVGAARPRASTPTSACCATRSTWASARASTTRCARRRPRSSSRSTPTSSSIRPRCASSSRASSSPRDRGGRRARPRLEPERELAHPAADDQVLLRPGAPEEPRARPALGDVPVGLPHRVSPPRADRARADPREPQHPRHPDQVRRGPLPHAPDRQARLPHAS